MRPFRDDRFREQNKYTRNANLNSQLKDLDMELEILKRQREIINQRQMGSALMSERQSMYNNPFPSFDRFEPTDKYGGNAHHNLGSSNKMVEKSYKRPSDRNWPSTSAPKQPRHINPWQDQYDNRPTFKPKPQPLMASAPAQFKKKVKPIPKTADKPRPEFNPTKVTKAKNVQNKPHTNIPHAAKKASTDTKAKKVFGPNEILRPFVDPTPSMKGRLELALGAITKDIKRSQNVDKPIMEQITFSSTQRQVKNVIRQRISSIMMNKIVGPPAEIVALYRQSFPDVVDDEIMTIINSAPAMKRPHVLVTAMPSKESAEISAFFKSNITRLLSDKMQEMIDNLDKLYGDNEKEILKCIIDLPNFEETISENNEDGSKRSIEEDEANKSNTEENKDKTTEDITKESDNAENNESSDKKNDGTGNNIEAKSSDTMAQETGEKDKPSKVEQYYKLMDLLITNRLPKLLVKFKDNFASVMYCEKDFIIAKDTIMHELKDKLRKAFYAANSLNSDGTHIEVSKTLPDPKVNGQSNTVSDPNPASDGKHTEVMKVDGSNTANISTQDNVAQKVNDEQLFVMLLGRPSLPSKPVIYEFLNKFNPQSIKKHKTVNNLLVISFNNKQDYDNILAANESKVGDSVFIIKANEVVSSEKISNINVSDEGNSEKITQKVQDDEVNKEMQEKSEMKEPENEPVTETTEENKMETIVEDNEDNELQIVEEEPDVIEVANETKNEAKSENKSVNDVNVATPVRSSSRLANVTPSTIKTRRASQLAQKNCN